MHADKYQKLLSNLLSKAIAKPVKVEEMIPIGGGSISRSYKLRSTAGSFFLKINSGVNAGKMFKAEANGLDLLRRNSNFKIPRVIGNYTDGNESFLLMEYIESANHQSHYWQDLASRLAELHRHTHNKFGLDKSNYIGSLLQKNTFEEDWPTFFINQRILPMVSMARNQALVTAQFVVAMESALPVLTEIMPKESPALVHGDLWSGNLMVDASGNPCLVDPAVYYGHREMDIAFSRLFGGFDEQFYQVYQQAYPMEPGYNERLDIYNLYPLMVHLNLFGRSYLGQIEMILARFT
jgi:protein-ribulosamine 3-kinase